MSAERDELLQLVEEIYDQGMETFSYRSVAWELREETQRSLERAKGADLGAFTELLTSFRIEILEGRRFSCFPDCLIGAALAVKRPDVALFMFERAEDPDYASIYRGQIERALG